jgi:hypothetical protein
LQTKVRVDVRADPRKSLDINKTNNANESGSEHYSDFKIFLRQMHEAVEHAIKGYPGGSSAEV